MFALPLSAVGRSLTVGIHLYTRTHTCNAVLSIYVLHGLTFACRKRIYILYFHTPVLVCICVFICGVFFSFARLERWVGGAVGVLCPVSDRVEPELPV